MAATRMAILVVMTVAATLWGEATAQSSCDNALISLSPCLDYVTGNSSTPTSSCCSQLANVVGSQPECLCQFLNGNTSWLGVTVNQTLAAALPGACNVQTPPASSCNASSPAGAPPSGTGSESPTGDNGSSAGTSDKLTFSLLFFLLVVGSYGSIFSTA